MNLGNYESALELLVEARELAAGLGLTNTLAFGDLIGVQ